MNPMRQGYISLSLLLILGLQPNAVVAQPPTIDLSSPNTESQISEIPEPLEITSKLPLNPSTLSKTELALNESIRALDHRIKQLEDRLAEPNTAPILQEEQDAYSVGLMVAQYANRVISDMKMVGITLDAAVIEKGILDGIAQRPRLPLPTAQTIITQLEAQMANSASQKEKGSQKILNDIAKTQNTVAKSNGMVWVSRKAGQSTTQKPTSMTVQGQYYLGALFDGPRKITLKNKDEMNNITRKAATLTGDNGVVELYAIARQVDDVATLPLNISPWDIVHFTFTSGQ